MEAARLERRPGYEARVNTNGAGSIWACRVSKRPVSELLSRPQLCSRYRIACLTTYCWPDSCFVGHRHLGMKGEEVERRMRG